MTERDNADDTMKVGLTFCKLCLDWKDAKIERKRILHFDKILSWVSLDPKS